MFDLSDDFPVRSADPEEGGEIARRSADPEEGGEIAHDVQPWTTTHGGVSATRAGTIPETPEDRSPDRPPELLYLLCRGPCGLKEVDFSHGNGPGYGFEFWFDRSATEAGSEGANLAPGTGALHTRVLSQDEPRQVSVFGTPFGLNEWDVRLPYNAFLRARVELAMSHLANLITRSDYVCQLPVSRVGARWVMDIATYQAKWMSSYYMPVTE